MEEGRKEGTIHRRIERDLVGGIGTKKMQRRRKKRVCTHIQEEYVHIPSWSRTFLETGSTISLLARPFRFIWTLGSRRRDTTFPFRLSWHSPSLLPRHFLQPPSFSTTSIRAIENVYRSREIWRDRVERFDPRLFRTTPPQEDQQEGISIVRLAFGVAQLSPSSFWPEPQNLLSSYHRRHQRLLAHLGPPFQQLHLPIVRRFWHRSPNGPTIGCAERRTRRNRLAKTPPDILLRCD